MILPAFLYPKILEYGEILSRFAQVVKPSSPNQG